VIRTGLRLGGLGDLVVKQPGKFRKTEFQLLPVIDKKCNAKKLTAQFEAALVYATRSACHGTKRGIFTSPLIECGSFGTEAGGNEDGMIAALLWACRRRSGGIPTSQSNSPNVVAVRCSRLCLARALHRGRSAAKLDTLRTYAMPHQQHNGEVSQISCTHARSY